MSRFQFPHLPDETAMRDEPEDIARGAAGARTDGIFPAACTWSKVDLQRIRVVATSYFGATAKVWLIEHLLFRGHHFENVVCVESALPEFFSDKVVNASVDFKNSIRDRSLHLVLLAEQNESFSTQAKRVGYRLN